MEYKHFSHQHNLSLLRLEAGQQYRCHGCELMCHDSSVYTCFKCNFFLHEHCGNANRYVRHPSHTMHPLVLTPSPTYCSGSFLCNGCGGPGSSFSYCCPLCEVDLHIHCAYLPPLVIHKAHQHELNLSFSSPGENGSPEYCKICTKQLSSKNWCYFCVKPECGFLVHTFCATTEVKPGLYYDDQPPEAQTPATNSSNSCANQPPTTTTTATNTAPMTPEDVAVEMMQLKMQMQMAEQLAQMMASFNLSHLV